MTTHSTIFRIGYLARRYGVSTEAIRLWERQGLMPPARRTPGGHRRYGAEHRRALDAIIIPAVTDADERPPRADRDTLAEERARPERELVTQGV